MIPFTTKSLNTVSVVFYFLFQSNFENLSLHAFGKVTIETNTVNGDCFYSEKLNSNYTLFLGICICTWVTRVKMSITSEFSISSHCFHQENHVHFFYKPFILHNMSRHNSAINNCSLFRDVKATALKATLFLPCNRS